MKIHRSLPHTFFAPVLIGTLLAFAGAASLHAQTSSGTKPAPATPPMDAATHATHLAAGANPGASPAPRGKVDPAVTQQLSQMQAKVAQLEAGLAKNAPPAAEAPAEAATPSAEAAATSVPSPGSAMDEDTTSAPPMASMSDTGSGQNMMGMMDKMMGMMDKMMSMGGGAAMSGDSGMDMKKMGDGSMPMPAKPATGMSGGSGMGMGKMERAKMMGMGSMPAAAPGAMPPSALPGFPGASHLYHIGATDFFLDHPEHITLTTEQQAALNQAKEQATLAQSTADRAIQQAEQELWTLTASDQPDAAKIQSKIAEIEKLNGDKRLGYIRAVGEASRLLTDEQRKSLTGFAPPTPAVPAAAPMKGM